MSTRSLNVPGSDSSALQTGSAAAPAGAPRPPTCARSGRRRRRGPRASSRSTSRITPSGPSSNARRRAPVAAVRPVVVEARAGRRRPTRRSSRRPGSPCLRERCRAERSSDGLAGERAHHARRASTGASTCSAGCVAGRGEQRRRRPVALAEAGAPEPGRRAVRRRPRPRARSAPRARRSARPRRGNGRRCRRRRGRLAAGASRARRARRTSRRRRRRPAARSAAGRRS